jgi:hypothetical protein
LSMAAHFLLVRCLGLADCFESNNWPHTIHCYVPLDFLRCKSLMHPTTRPRYNLPFDYLKYSMLEYKNRKVWE